MAFMGPAAELCSRGPPGSAGAPLSNPAEGSIDTSPSPPRPLGEAAVVAPMRSHATWTLALIDAHIRPGALLRANTILDALGIHGKDLAIGSTAICPTMVYVAAIAAAEALLFACFQVFLTVVEVMRKAEEDIPLVIFEMATTRTQSFQSGAGSAGTVQSSVVTGEPCCSDPTKQTCCG
eukprot:CAMPEP_0180574776 /NCGR_PEP_ID=MMETSP1037_2-20121125/10521_1 /TAXON_ID=632150 /ORGANISM="Azadinium spinosum, Strain 3D9" /LENGTH=178 /DNA_ID=CAMNT_0022592359 /DNA_START=240 /DNA_END=776 /DNA_ORIENTATION=+